MRTFIYDLLTNPARPGAAALAALVGGRVRSSGGGDGLLKPFIVIRDLSDSNPIGAVRQGSCSIWVHDDPDSYVKIDDIIIAIRDIMNSFAPQWWGNIWVMELRDQGWSEDLFDDHYGTATKYGTYAHTAHR